MKTVFTALYSFLPCPIVFSPPSNLYIELWNIPRCTALHWTYRTTSSAFWMHYTSCVGVFLLPRSALYVFQPLQWTLDEFWTHQSALCTSSTYRIALVAFLEPCTGHIFSAPYCSRCSSNETKRSVRFERTAPITTSWYGTPDSESSQNTAPTYAVGHLPIASQRNRSDTLWTVLHGVGQRENALQALSP